MAEVEYSRSVEGDEEYWMQNQSALLDEDPEESPQKNDLSVKDRNKSESVIDSGFEPIDAK